MNASLLGHHREYWKNQTVAVIGGGAWGTVLAHLASRNAREVRMLVRQEDLARSINVGRENPNYVPGLALSEKVKAFPTIERVFEQEIQAMIWALPSEVTRVEARKLASRIRGDEVIIHASKGIEPESFKRISEIFLEELPHARVGVVSGPNLATEIARGDPSVTLVASAFDEVIASGQALLEGPHFKVLGGHDVVGAEWAGAMKNIYAIAMGAIDTLGMGWNTRAFFLTRSLEEMVQWVLPLGGKEETLRGVAGMGDLLATCSSSQSRNYRVGAGLARGEPIEQVLAQLGSTAEGVKTVQTVHEFALKRGKRLPLASGVYDLVTGRISAAEMVKQLSR